MRVSKEQAAENRARILAETARMIREAGIGGVGVDALTRAAGLTHGSLYSQFGSKERLVAEALAHALENSGDKTRKELGAPDGALATVVARYLSPAHRDAPGGGCALAAIGPEAARQGGSVRRVFTARRARASPTASPPSSRPAVPSRRRTRRWRPSRRWSAR